MHGKKRTMVYFDLFLNRLLLNLVLGGVSGVACYITLHYIAVHEQSG